jgi:hypothetical protein
VHTHLLRTNNQVFLIHYSFLFIFSLFIIHIHYLFLFIIPYMVRRMYTAPNMLITREAVSCLTVAVHHAASQLECCDSASRLFWFAYCAICCTAQSRSVNCCASNGNSYQGVSINIMTRMNKEVCLVYIHHNYATCCLIKLRIGLCNLWLPILSEVYWQPLVQLCV